MKIDKETEHEIQQLQLLEQNMQNFLLQKQQFQSQLIEVDSALEEIKDKKEAYKIIGNIMVNTTKEELEKDLKKKKKMLDIKIRTLEKQEEKIKEKQKKIQEEVYNKIKDKKD